MVKRFLNYLWMPFLLCCPLTAVPISCSETTWYVDDDAPGDPGPGDASFSDPEEDGSAAHPFDAIQEAILETEQGDCVLVMDGTYTGTENKNLDFWGKDITVRSRNGPERCVIDMEWSGTGFYLHQDETQDARVEGFTMTHGQFEEGGAISCLHSSPTIMNCVITDNIAMIIYQASGGGIYCSHSQAVIVGCTLTHNNSAWSGGGIGCRDYGSPKIIRCTIMDNIGGSYGGGISVWHQCDAQISDCAIISNTAMNYGGGIRVTRSSPTITNCLIIGNRAMHRGGGLYIYEQSYPVIMNCTIADNTGVDLGGGLFCYVETDPTLMNTILWNNEAAVGPEVWLGNYTSTTLRYSDVDGGLSSVFIDETCSLNWEEGMISADPLFVPGPLGAYYLSQITSGRHRDGLRSQKTADSPCVDTGDPQNGPIGGTTRTDSERDAGITDMGFHYPPYTRTERWVASPR